MPQIPVRCLPFLLLPFFFPVQAGGQTTDETPILPYHLDTISLRSADTIRLARQFILPRSLSLSFDTVASLRDSIDYVLDARNGFLVLTGEGVRRLSFPVQVVARYQALPFHFEKEYRLRTLRIRRDTVRGDTISVATPSAPLNMESIFGSELQKSGYIGRGFTVGSNRDLTLNSGFRLQLNGKLAEDIDIMAALTDENTPIQPEGNTRTIQELDKVFIKLSGHDMSATLGDFNIAYGGTEFGRYNRKLSGFLGEARSDLGSLSGSFASLKGIFHSVQFNGIDGVQGPYRLTGRNGEQRIVVLAGTERVYMDGVEMVRGENNDYVIEYASGELFFRPKRLITSYARITVDFEYADRAYTRNLVTAGGATQLFNGRLGVTARYLREGDDQDAPLDFRLSETDLAVLRNAGDDRQKASTTGITYIGIDTSKGAGAGQYVRVDTTVSGVQVTFYRYSPGSDSATYALSFSYVGSGNGDYVRKVLGVYEWRGTNRGDYAPVRLLPMPQLHQAGTVLISGTPVRNLSLTGELAVSSLDRNRFSDLDEEDDAGEAYNLALNWSDLHTAVGVFDIGGRFRSTASAFNPVDRVNEIEFNRRWDIVTSSPTRETIHEGTFGYKPLSFARVFGGAGSISRGAFSSLRLDGGLTMEPAQSDSGVPRVRWTFEHITSDDNSSGTVGRWFRQRGEASQRFAIAEPRLRFEQERRTSHLAGRDSLNALSLAFLDVRPGVQFSEFWNMTVAVDVGYRSEDAVLNGRLERQSQDFLQQYTWALKPWNNLSANASLIVRDRSYTDAFRMLGYKDLQTILTKSGLQYSPLQRAIVTDLYYEVSTERTSRLERVFIKVPFGQGNYVFKGDLNGNGVADEFEFEPTRFDGEYVLLTLPTDQLFPVIDLRTSARVQFRPSRFITTANPDLLGSALKALSSETFLRVDEKSSDERTSNVYLIKLGTFLNDSTTLRGLQNVRQDLFLFEQSPAFSMRLRFDQVRGFSQYALASERSFRRERSIRVKTQLVREIGLQTDLAFLNDAVRSTGATNRARDIAATAFTADFSYRPYARVEVGFVLGSKSAVDHLPVAPVDAAINSQTLRTTVSFDGPGRIRAELERNDVVLVNAADRFPFELTDGKSEGKSWVWRLNVDYRLTSFMQATLSYLGRVEGERPAIHTARAEVRAFF